MADDEMKRWWSFAGVKRYGRSFIICGPRLWRWRPQAAVYVWSPGNFGLWVGKDEDEPSWSVTVALVVVRLHLSYTRMFTRREYAARMVELAERREWSRTQSMAAHIHPIEREA